MVPDLASPVQLVWEAPEGCPSKESISGQIEQLLAGWQKPDDAPVTARARVFRGGKKGWRVEVTTDNGTAHGERTLDAETCVIAAKATALVIVLALAPELADEMPAPHDKRQNRDPEPDSKREVEPLEKSVVAVSPVELPVPESPPPRKPPAQWLIGARGIGTVGRLPAPSVGIGGVAGVRIGGLRIEAGGAAWLSRDISSGTKTNVGARFRTYAADLRACYGPRFLTWTFSGCMGATVGRLDAEGFGEPTRFRGGEWQAGPLGAALVTWEPRERWALRIQTDIGYQVLGRHNFVLYGSEHAYRAPRLRGDLSLGLELHF